MRRRRDEELYGAFDEQEDELSLEAILADPTQVVQQHRNSSMVMGLKMLADGSGDAFISAGNTGALLTAATLLVKRIRGIRRAAFAPLFPTKAVLIDAGANAECTPEFLMQFGCMGSLYAQKALGIAQPRVALLNNGAEEGKGDELHKSAYDLLKKADENDIRLPGEVAFFIAKRLRSNVRELEGALNRVIANANFTGRAITIDFVREALRDLLALQEKLVTIDNIQKTVAEYYKIKVADLLSKRRSRAVARPRQMAMALAKELTNHSLPEIGDAFGGRDHTTVLHACRKIEQLREESHDIKEDFSNLIRTLSS